MSERLDGARILCTRPPTQQAGLVAAIEALGGVALPLPLFNIEPAADEARLRAALRAAAARDHWWLFTSRNAAEAACRLLPPPWPPRVAAVGAGTARVLRHAGVAEVLVPTERFSAAALVALPEFAEVRGLGIAFITGEDGRTEAATELATRGARLETLALYRRVPHPQAPDHVARLIEQADAAVLTSAGALDQLLAVTPAGAQTALRRMQLVVPAPRVVELARSRGFAAPALLPEQITDAAYARALAGWWARRPEAARSRSIPPRS